MKRILTFLLAIFIVSCTSHGEIEPKPTLDSLRTLDEFETVNETAMCFDAHEEDGTLVIDSLSKPFIYRSTPVSVTFKPCKGYNGVWHTHPSSNVVRMSENDVEYLLWNDVKYSMISIDDDFGAWRQKDLLESESRAKFPTYFRTLKN